MNLGALVKDYDRMREQTAALCDLAGRAIALLMRARRAAAQRLAETYDREAVLSLADEIDAAIAVWEWGDFTARSRLPEAWEVETHAGPWAVWQPGERGLRFFRLVCKDGSVRTDLGGTLEQLATQRWRPITEDGYPAPWPVAESGRTP